MASQSVQAKAHRARQALRPPSWLAETEAGAVLTNPCDWLHDTAVTNRAEKRRALAQAKKYGCQEEKKADEKRGTATTWVHAKACPGWKAPEKAPVPLPSTPAGRMQAVHDLLRAPVVDDEGNTIGVESLISPEEARRMLEAP